MIKGSRLRDLALRPRHHAGQKGGRARRGRGYRHISSSSSQGLYSISLQLFGLLLPHIPSLIRSRLEKSSPLLPIIAQRQLCSNYPLLPHTPGNLRPQTPSFTMSISGLANIAMPNIPLPSQPISAATTRILALTNFSPQIKTKDLHQAFQPWAEDKGGYKIKWIDDVTALAVFNDATTGE
jgi:hypothetical protein